jgi:hypothetical protein
VSPALVPPPRWSPEEFEAARQEAIRLFRQERMQEPLEAYLEAFDDHRSSVEELLEATVDLSRLGDLAVEVLSDEALLGAVRYLAGPPISTDDLKVLAEATLAPGRLKSDPEMARRVVDTVLLGLDRNRFPWVGEDREPTEAERAAAAIASAALLASRKVMTSRANEAKTAQEETVAARLLAENFTEVVPRTIRTLDDAPGRGEFCRECMFGGRKADLVVRLRDGRAMPIECKVSNSSTNSVKRLNNDAAVKAVAWLEAFGKAQTVPAAVLAGVFKRHNLEQAQTDGLSLFWAHDLTPLITFVNASG